MLRKEIIKHKFKTIVPLRLIVQLQKFKMERVGKRLKKSVADHGFTIICNNCWGGKIYQQMKLPYNTPFVGLFLFAPCYIELLNDFESYMHMPLNFVEKSKYTSVNEDREKNNNYYPIGSLGNKIEIHFLHYNSNDAAASIWKRRTERMNWNKLFFAFSERDLCKNEHIWAFDRFSYKNKVCFTANNYPDCTSTVWVKEYEQAGEVGDIYTHNGLIDKYFSVAEWLNQNKNPKY